MACLNFFGQFSALVTRLAVLFCCICLACSGKTVNTDEQGDGDGDSGDGDSDSGDGDGDSGDGDGDSGDGDGDSAGDGDGDGDSGDGDGDGNPSSAEFAGEVDLLFVVDNSTGMKAKQEILRRSVPQMIKRFLTPRCVTQDGSFTEEYASAGGNCSEGAPEFSPVESLHVGVISSSLGGHGSNNCQRGAAEKDNDDRGRLIPSVRPDNNLPEAESGFLSWDGGGTDAAREFSERVVAHLQAVGARGCGFEAPLEAWYRFLVDPNPPLDLVVGDDNRATATGVDEVVLQQREAFLRPNSLVGIVLVSDENDCSAMDGGVYYNNAGFGYLIASTRIGTSSFNMPIATEICETNPNAKCCFSCLQANNPPDGCEVAATVCEQGGPSLSSLEDNANVRCFHNRRRFGVDLLYPTTRYSDALSQAELIDARTGAFFANPLLRGAGAHAGTARDSGNVFFTSIVGVPWQDVATPESLPFTSDRLELQRAEALSDEDVPVLGRTIDRWELMLGQPGLPESSRACDDSAPGCGVAPVPPADPFMIESVDPREAEAKHPLIDAEILPPDSSEHNAVNGHEFDSTLEENGVARDELQYACIFALETPLDCSADDVTCSCTFEPGRMRPLCQLPGESASTTQYSDKAYPSTRILQVQKDFGNQSIVGSICPKNPVATDSTDQTDPYYGYNPVLDALVDRMAEKFPD